MSIPFRLQIPQTLHEAMIAQAVAELPNECCGLFAGNIAESGTLGRVGCVTHRYPLANAAASPVEYLSDPRGMFEAVRAMQRAGIELLAVYHSHPTSNPIPSRKDLDRNYSEDVVNVIVSLKDGTVSARGWWLTATGFSEATIDLIGEQLT